MTSQPETPPAPPPDSGRRADRAFRGFLVVLGALFLAAALGIGYFAWRFHPIFSIDEKTQRLILLGGLVDLNGREGKFKIGSAQMEADVLNNSFSGSKSVGAKPRSFGGPIVMFAIEALDSKLNLATGPEGKVSWKCQSAFKDDQPQIHEVDGAFTLDLKAANGAKCEIEVPARANVAITAARLQLTLDQPRFHLVARLINANVDIKPVENERYHFDFGVTNGKIDEYFRASSSADPAALQFTISIANGMITRTP